VAKAKIKASMDALDVRVQKIIDVALEHSRMAPLDVLPDLPEIMGKLERAFQLAMATRQPGHAVVAAMAQATSLTSSSSSLVRRVNSLI
jgi:hypothetical protein